MTPDDQIIAMTKVVDAASGAAAEHLERATNDLPIPEYTEFLGATLLNVRAMLACCTKLASDPGGAAFVEGLLACASESVRLLYVAMIVMEKRQAARPGADAPARPPGGPRSCSFCGKAEPDAKLVAGPIANICGSCTRLACGVLGIALSDTLP